ncbi:N utilization substance protein B homolog [Rhodospirillaceae bacterium LM-1]|nr:N utilization substance protein B homolog [Rhodospirillaceae bacterium LM-1]
MSSSSSKDPLPKRRAVARLMAVQALYQIQVADQTVDEVLAQHLAGPLRLDEDDADADIAAPDREHLVAVVRDASGKSADIDVMISKCLSSGWELERIEPLLRAILQAGVAELCMGKKDLPPKAVISEYTDIARSFYDGPEVGLVNAVLDRLAKTLHDGKIG